MKHYDITLLREMPVIRRAREYHLFDNTGKRFLDLYLDGGKALLGHRPEGFSLIVKNTLARGVYASYPSHEEANMLRAAKILWERYPQIRYYNNSKLVELWLAEQGLIRSVADITDPCLAGTGRTSLWRPWMPAAEDVIFPVLPVPGECGILVCAKDSIAELPQGDLPSPVNAAGINRCLWNLTALLKKSPECPADSQRQLPAFAGWCRKANYLLWEGENADYPSVFRRFLVEGVLLPPDPDCPAVLPPVLTSGDLKILNKLFGKGE